MKIVVMGAGAIGSLYGGLLQQLGHEVTLIGREPHVNAIIESGLRIRGAYGDYTVQPHAITDPAEVSQADIVIITTKSYDTVTAAQQIQHLSSSGSYIMCLQNGLGTEIRVEKALQTKRILRGTTCAGAQLTEPGLVVAMGKGLTEIGTHHPENDDLVHKIAAVFREAGFAVNTSDNIEGVVWTKTIVNCGLNPIAALTGLTNGEIYRDYRLRGLVIRLVEEAVAVANALGVRLTTDDPIRYTLGTAKATSDNLNSMLQDILAGKKTEVDYILGEVIRLAQMHGIETPFSEIIYALVKAFESRMASSKSVATVISRVVSDEILDTVFTL